MDIVQYILLAVIVLVLLRTGNMLRKGKIHFADFLLWLVFWGAVSSIVIFPQVTQMVADLVGIGRGADLVLYLGMIGLYYFMYATIVKVKQLDQKITKLGRSVAIENAHDGTNQEKGNE